MGESSFQGFKDGFVEGKIKNNSPFIEVHIENIMRFCKEYGVKRYLPEHKPKEASDLEDWISVAEDINIKISLGKINPKKMELGALICDYYSFSEICEYKPLQKSVESLIESVYQKIGNSVIPQ